MVLQDSPALDRVFHALSNPTRRRMLRSLAAGRRNIGDLAEPFRMSFAGAAKHVRVLEEAGLVRRKVLGREHVLTLDPKQLANADEWLRYYERLWNAQFETLDAVFKAENENKTKPKKKRNKR